MAYFFGDGFSLYNSINDSLASYWDSGVNTNVTLQSPGRFAGTQCVRLANVTVAPFVKSSGQNDVVHHINVAFYQSAALSGTTLGLYFQFTDVATNQCCIVFRSDGAILLTSATPAGTVLATYTGAVTAINTWFSFEFEVVISATVGRFQARKNGNLSDDFDSGATLNTRPGTNSYANKLTIGSAGNINYQQFTDVLWRSDASTVSWAGDIRCFTRVPVSDASVQWSRSSTTISLVPYTGTTSATGSALNGARYTPFTSQGGTIGAIVLTTSGTGSVNVKCAIFTDAAGQPGTVIQSATAAIANPPTGANTFTFSPAVSITAGTRFWVGVISDAAVASLWSAAATAPFTTAGWTATAVTYASWPQANPGSLTAGAATNAAPTITATANANWVADLPEDGAASYVFDATVGQADMYGIGAIASTPSTIVGVVTRGFLQKSDAGTRVARVQLKSSATTVQSSDVVLNTSFAWGWRTDLTDPSTTAAWTPTGVNNAQIGVVVQT